MLTGQTDIRFIDIYNLKNTKPFEFFKLKEVETSSFIEEVEISALLKVAVSIKSRQVDKEKKKINYNMIQPTNNNNTTDQSTIKNITITNENTKSSINMNNTSSMKPKTTQNTQTKNIHNTYEQDSLYSIVNKETKEDKKIQQKEEIYIEPINTPNTKKEKIKKLPKGKPVELDVKLGKLNNYYINLF